MIRDQPIHKINMCKFCFSSLDGEVVMREQGSRINACLQCSQHNPLSFFLEIVFLHFQDAEVRGAYLSCSIMFIVHCYAWRNWLYESRKSFCKSVVKLMWNLEERVWFAMLLYISWPGHQASTIIEQCLTNRRSCTFGRHLKHFLHFLIVFFLVVSGWCAMKENNIACVALECSIVNLTSVHGIAWHTNYAAWHAVDGHWSWFISYGGALHSLVKKA